MRDNFKLISGIVAISVYFALLGIIFYIFNYKTEIKPVNYVKKNTGAIEVSLTGSKQKTPKKEGKKKEQKSKPEQKPKKIRNITSKNKTPTKSKTAKKPAKKIKTSSLFSSVETEKKSNKIEEKKSKKQERSASQKISDSIKKPRDGAKGVEDRYFAQIKEKLQGWPAQVNYAGETISVQLTVYKSGKFEFKVQKLSSNSEFNEALIAYLKQLQQIGLDRHNRAKPYDIVVEFEAKQ